MSLPPALEDAVRFPIFPAFCLKCEKDEFLLQNVDKSKPGHLRESGRPVMAQLGVCAAEGLALSLPGDGQLPPGIFRAK